MSTGWEAVRSQTCSSSASSGLTAVSRRRVRQQPAILSPMPRSSPAVMFRSLVRSVAVSLLIKDTSEHLRAFEPTKVRPPRSFRSVHSRANAVQE
eukprot:5205170-Alexandrium_andersonii.AAC.1